MRDVRGLSGSDLALCQQLLSAVKRHVFNLNKGLSTIQFQSLSVAADNYKHVQGGIRTMALSRRIPHSTGRRSFTATAANQVSTSPTRRCVLTPFRTEPRCQFPECGPDEMGDHLRTNRHQPGGSNFTRQSSPIRIPRVPARSSKAHRASGEPRTGAAIRHSSKPIVPSSPHQVLRQRVATSSKSDRRETPI
jgi:hypothetical protein